MPKISSLVTAAAVAAAVLCQVSRAHAEPPKPPAEGDVAVKAALVRSLAGSDLRTAPVAAAAESSAPVLATRAGTVEPMRAGRLTEIRGEAKSGAINAGAARDIAVATGAAAAAARPTAGIRVQRRMNVERVIGELATATRACSEQTGVRAASTASFQLSVLPTGEVESAAPASTGGAPKEAVACAQAAFAKVRFGAPGAAGATILVPIAFAPVKASSVAKAPEAPVAPAAPVAPEPVAIAAAAPTPGE